MARTTEPVFRRPGSEVYYAWVPDPRTGKSVMRSTKHRIQADAIAWRRRYLRAEQDPAGAQARTATVQGILNDFLESRVSRTKSNGRPLAKDTLEFYQAKASMVEAVLGADMLAAKIDAATIDAYLKARRADLTQRGERVTDHTISKELAVLRAALQRAKRVGKWRGDLDAIFPSTGDFSPGYDPRKAGAKALSREDVAKILASTPAEARSKLAVVAFGIACAAELSALARARRSDVAPDRSVVHVRGTKNANRDRVVPVAILEQAYLLDFALTHAPGTGDVLFPSLANVRRDMRLMSKRAGVKDFSPHALRHTLALWLRSGGVDSATTGALLGHADGRMVERIYGRLDATEDARSAIVAQYKPADRSLIGTGGGSGSGRHSWQNGPSTEAAIFPADAVRRDGIEPPTRGFSIPGGSGGSAVECGVSGGALIGFCTASGPEAEVKRAIKAAVDGDRLDLAAKLLDVLRDERRVVAVVDIASVRDSRTANAPGSLQIPGRVSRSR